MEEFRMKLFKKQSAAELQSREPRLLYVLLSFFLPFAIMLIAIAGLGITPFGDHTLVISDANGYYINTLAYAGRLFRGMEGITYSFEKGLGGNMADHLNGILLTPFSFLFSFADITRYPTVFSFVSMLSLSLCGLTMYLFLADQYGYNGDLLIFSTSYALMGFNVSNVFQAVFFSAAPILPLMAMGLKKLMQGKSPFLYIFAIMCGLVGNAFFGFVLCAASVLFFFTEFFVFAEKYDNKKRTLFLRYAISSVCGGLLASVLWLPAFLSLRGGRMEQNGITDFSFIERQPLLEIGTKLFTGANTQAELANGHPNIYVGILPVALVVLFFLHKGTEKKKKIAGSVLLSIYLLAFTILAFDMVMHGGTQTNWFNFRYSYVFSFLLLLIASSVWERLDSVSYTEIKRCFMIMVISAMLVFSRRYEYVIGGEVVLDFALLLLCFLTLRMHRSRPEVNTKKNFELITLILVCIGLFLNYRICTKNIQEWETKESDYQKTVLAVDPLVKGVQGADSSFFRMEVNRQRSGVTGNDPMLYGYNGVGHGSSNERDFVRVEGYKLGIPWFSNRAYYADGIPAATDALLGVKYVIAEENLTEEKGYEKRINIDDWGLYENHDALSPVILSEKHADEVETDLVNVFDNLNRVWAAVSGVDNPVFNEEKDIAFQSFNMTDPISLSAANAREAMDKLDAEDTEDDDSSTSNRTSNPVIDRTEKPEGTAYIEYSWIAKQDGPVYVYERNGISDRGAGPNPSIAWIGNYHKGDTVTGYIRANLSYITQPVMEELCGRFRAAYANNEVLHELSETVRSRPVTVEKVRDTLLQGSFTAENNQLLLFTIPWDEGWTLTIDGKNTELAKVFGLFMAAEVPAGEHIYEMQFEAAGFRVGMLTSIAAFVFLPIFLFLDRNWRKRSSSFSAQQ